jgi:hypothetical protein
LVAVLPVVGTVKNLSKIRKVDDVIKIEKETNKTYGIIDKVIAVEGEPWTKGPGPRGQIIDEALGNNLGTRFPCVDKLNRAEGTLTSIKSVEVTLPSFQKGKNLEYLLRRYIRELRDFEKNYFKGKEEIIRENVTLNLSDYKSKILEVAIPDVKLSKQQLQCLENAKTYAKSLNMKLLITVVK